MQLSTGAKEIRALAERLAQISELDTNTDTGEPGHEINASELARLKLALRPLVSDELQSRFMQVLNKLSAEQPITFAESKLLTAAFASMADIIASDNSLIQRMRSDIRDFNVSAEEDNEAGIAANVKPELDAAKKPMISKYEPK
jgi:hypothetical protein